MSSVGDCQYNNIYVAACASHQSGPNFTVNSTSDTDDGYCDALGAYDNCTLREAINAANALSGADVINIPAGTYTLAIAGTGEDANATGDLDITDELTINGTGAKASDVIIQAGTDSTNGIDRVFHMVNDVPFTIANITVANGKTSTDPADSTGGGIENLAGGDLTVLNSIFSGNTSIYGGGINHYYGALIVMNTTFSDNTIRPGGGGGGIHNAFNNSAQIINSTFSGNQATNGGGIANASNGSMTVTNSTFSGNLATNGSAGSGIRNENSAVDSVILQNTIIADGGGGGDCYGVITANTYNLDSDGTCGDALQKTSLEINLGALADNGGATPTMSLESDSSATDTGDNAVCADANTVNNFDQRGKTRPQGAACDIGAYEFDPAPSVVSINRVHTETNAKASVQFTVTFSEPVTGVDTSDFSLTKTVTGGAISAVSGNGTTRTVTVITGSGDGTIRLDVKSDAVIIDSASQNVTPLPFTSGETYTINKTLTYKSQAANDGWVLESTETSNTGGKLNNGSATLNVGDDAANRQYRAILSFNTTLPAGAVITNATLKFKFASATGTLSFSLTNKLLVDVKKVGFSNNPALQLNDFTATANKSGLFAFAQNVTWFTKNFTPAQFTYINKSGVTQFRLRFAKDDNNDLGADFIKIHSGSATTASDRPQLIIKYYVP